MTGASSPAPGHCSWCVAERVADLVVDHVEPVGGDVALVVRDGGLPAGQVDDGARPVAAGGVPAGADTGAVGLHVPGLTRRHLEVERACAASASTRWKDIRPPCPHDRGSDRASSRRRRRTRAVDVDAVLDLDDEPPQRTGPVDLRRPGSDAPTRVPAPRTATIGRLAGHLAARGSRRRRPRPRPSVRSRRSPPRSPTGEPRRGGGVGAGAAGENATSSERDDRGDGEQRERVGAPAVAADEAAEPAGAVPARSPVAAGGDAGPAAAAGDQREHAGRAAGPAGAREPAEGAPIGGRRPRPTVGRALLPLVALLLRTSPPASARQTSHAPWRVGDSAPANGTLPAGRQLPGARVATTAASACVLHHARAPAAPSPPAPRASPRAPRRRGPSAGHPGRPRPAAAPARGSTSRSRSPQTTSVGHRQRPGRPPRIGRTDPQIGGDEPAHAAGRSARSAHGCSARSRISSTACSRRSGGTRDGLAEAHADHAPGPLLRRDAGHPPLGQRRDAGQEQEEECATERRRHPVDRHRRRDERQGGDEVRPATGDEHADQPAEGVAQQVDRPARRPRPARSTMCSRTSTTARTWPRIEYRPRGGGCERPKPGRSTAQPSNRTASRAARSVQLVEAPPRPCT